MPGLKELAEGRRSDIFYIPPSALKVRDGWNARDAADPEFKRGLDELAQSIATIGVIEPLTVFKDGESFFVSNGHRRLAATLLAIKNGAEIAAIPVKTLGRGANDQDYALQQLLTGAPLKPLEQGTVYKRFLAWGWSVDKISKACGASPSHINSCVDLQAAPVEVREMVREGRLAASTAAKVIRSDGPEKAVGVLRNAVDKAKQDGRTKATARDVGGEPKAPKARVLTQVKEALTEALIAGEEYSVEDADVTLLAFPDAKWREIAKLLGI